MILADALRRGYQVAIPLSEDFSYDLIVERAGTLERVQCKFTRSDGEVVIVKAASTSAWNRRVRGTKRYTANDIEWLAVYDATTDRCYFIPASELASGRIKVSLRLTPPKNGQQQKIRLASAYTDW